jgi:hypothetical protein
VHWGGPILHIAAALPRDPLPYIDSATAGAGGAFLGVCCFLGLRAVWVLIGLVAGWAFVSGKCAVCIWWSLPT